MFGKTSLSINVIQEKINFKQCNQIVGAGKRGGIGAALQMDGEKRDN